MTPGEQLLRHETEIKAILAVYGARKVRIFGSSEPMEYGDGPEVDVLVNFDCHKNIDSKILVCFRCGFEPPGGRRKRWMEKGGTLIRNLQTLLDCRVSVCSESAVKNFHPVTCARTASTHKWT
jgi:hypothetical protein